MNNTKHASRKEKKDKKTQRKKRNTQTPPCKINDSFSTGKPLYNLKKKSQISIKNQYTHHTCTDELTLSSS